MQKTKSTQILFKKDNDGFTKELNSTVKSNLSKRDIQKAVFLLWLKLLFYLLFFFVSIYILYLNPYGDSFLHLLINYILIGISGVLLAFNSAHDACHQTFSKKKWLNDFIFFFTFNMQGTNARLFVI